MTRTLSTDQLFRHLIGFDRVAANAANFPPHNIEKLDEDRYQLTLAVAGFAREEIEMYVHQGTLTISGRKDQTDVPRQFLHQGIALRDWDRQFNLGEHIVVANAALENRLLVINFERRVPEAHKPKLIPIF